ncbi:MAG: tetratricopeptide repeat protein [Eggerthellaceae bacterium]|nr:tetratricopeptide repeat protein [Eggerthellaceae bacterium]
MGEDRAFVTGRRTTYSLKRAALWGASSAVLSEAVPAYVPVASDVHSVRIPDDRVFGWVSGGLPAPFREDAYVVEFSDETEVAVLAYIDRFGRAFSCLEPSVAPPARIPDLTMVRLGDLSSNFEERGCFMMAQPSGESRTVARYRKVNGRYEIYDSWFDFSGRNSDLSYIEAMARVYLACVFRPALTGVPIPDAGLSAVDDLLAAPNVVAGLRALMVLLDRLKRDGACRPPAVVECLDTWLTQAGFTEEASYRWLAETAREEGGPLRLVRLDRTSNLFFLARRREDSPVDAHTVWALESALNRYLLLKQKLGDKASCATMAEVAHWDEYIREHVATQAPHASHPLDEGLEEPSGEWDVRVSHAHGLELLRVPFRFEAAFHVDVAQPGVAAWMVMGPDESLMPQEAFDEEANQWRPLSAEERQKMACTYNRHLAIALAAISFNATTVIQSVMVSVRPFSEVSALTSALLCQVTFDRAHFVEKRAYRVAAAGDPAPFLQQAGECILCGVPTAAPFSCITERPSYSFRLEAPELASGPISHDHQGVLGARDVSQLRISYDAEMVRVAESLAEQLRDTESASAAVAIVRQMQWDTGSPLVYKGCTRLMTALTAGDLEPTNSQEVRRAFIGESELAKALTRAQTMAQSDPDAAADLLIATVKEEEAHHRWHDSSEVVYRLFDSYSARILFNRDHSDGRTVELVPPTLLMSLLEVVNLLDESFQRFDEAVAFAERCLLMAPTSPYAHCRCARAYVLSGDLETAERLLLQALECALVPEEIALAYYQLGYVEWKLGRVARAEACYGKSLALSPTYAMQISAEMQKLVAETGASMLQRDQVDDVLVTSGLPLAPSAGRLEQLREEVRAAVDEGVFAVARPLLGLYLHYRPDDELTDVLQSLGDPRIDEILEA